MKLDLLDEQVKRIITALLYYAQTEAGQTQRPYLCVPADYEEYSLAHDLQRRLDMSIKLRNQWVTDPQTGETIRRACNA